MSEEFKKWLCEKAELNQAQGCSILFHFGDDVITEYTLIKAMWAINRCSEWEIMADKYGFNINCSRGHKSFFILEYNSEQEALTKALEYIYNNTKGDNT